METLRHRQALRSEVAAQSLAKPCRAAEPEAGLLPPRHGGTDALAGQQAVAGIDQHVQAYIGGLGIRLEPFYRCLVIVGSGME